MNTHSHDRRPQPRRARRGHALPRVVRAIAVAAALAALAAACGDDDDATDADDTPAEGTSETVRLLTHDSFTMSDEVREAFTARTGIEIELLQGGDAGTVVNQAILTSGNPQADVLFGIDSTFLTRALEADLFVPYEAVHLADVPEELRIDPDHRVTPIDYGDVCLNYDVTWFNENELEPPAALADLTDPAYEGLAVVQNPATSSPGLAFLLATVATFGEDDWVDFWADLRANDVEVTEGWEAAYYGSFSGGSGSEGDRPIVVSYATSPAAEVIFADPPVDDAPTAVVEDGCYRQVEYAGVLAGTDDEDAARQVVDLLLSEDFQAEIPLSMFVFPARADVDPPAEFTDHVVTPASPLELPADEISANRDGWIEQWTDLMLG